MFTLSGQTEISVVSKFLLAAGSVWLELDYFTFNCTLILCFSQLFSFVLLLKIGLCCLSLKFDSCTADIQKNNFPFLLCCCKSDLCVWFPWCAIVCVYVYLCIWCLSGKPWVTAALWAAQLLREHLLSTWSLLSFWLYLGGLRRGHNYLLLLILFWMHSLLFLQVNGQINLNCSYLRPLGTESQIIPSKFCTIPLVQSQIIPSKF